MTSVQWKQFAALLPFLLGACGDCFFVVGGKLTDCQTQAPLAGAIITVRIDSGLHGMHLLPKTFDTDGSGRFSVTTDGTEDCGASATLMIRKAGYAPLDAPVKGTSKDVALCLTHGS